MAQGDTVTLTSLGEKVEVTFQLDFKRADVRARPDADRFAELQFVMRVAARKASFFTRQFTEADPAFIDLTAAADDSVVRVVFRFISIRDDGTQRFLPGDSVDLHCLFSSKDGSRPDDIDPILLGTVRIPPAKS